MPKIDEPEVDTKLSLFAPICLRSIPRWSQIYFTQIIDMSKLIASQTKLVKKTELFCVICPPFSILPRMAKKEDKRGIELDQDKLLEVILDQFHNLSLDFV